MWCWWSTEKIKSLEKLSIEEVFGRIGKKSTLLNNIRRRKTNWIGHILRRNYLFHNAIERQMTEVKEI